jgi:hypothetical protein
LKDSFYFLFKEAELKRKHEHELDEKLSRAESEHLAKVAGLHGGLAGLLSSLEQRAEGDKAAVAAQELWLACLAMENAIRSGREGVATWEEKVRPLNHEISAIQVQLALVPYQPRLGGGEGGGGGGVSSVWIRI